MNRLSISHIAWPPELEEELIDQIRALDIGVVELAPLRAFGNPLAVTEKVVRERADWFCHRGCRIGSFQALLFGAGEVYLFDDQNSRNQMKSWLIAVGRVAGWCGAGPMVFGSPRNRLKGKKTHAEAMEIAVPFFREVGDACAAFGSCLVMEANPEAYGADFCTKLEQAAELVAMVDSPGFQLHVDAGGLALSGESFESVILQSVAVIGHVHASQPNLIGWHEPDPVHDMLAKALMKAGYSRGLAIEMRAQDDIITGVGKAVRSVRAIYGDLA